MDATLMCGDDARRIQLCDLFLSEVEYTRPHAATALGAVSNQGKTNRVSYACTYIFGHTSVPAVPVSKYKTVHSVACVVFFSTLDSLCASSLAGP